VGGIGAFVNVYSVVGALAAVALMALHGAVYLALKAPEDLAERIERWAYRAGRAATVGYFGFVVLSYFYAHFEHRLGINPGPIPVLAGVSMVSMRLFLPRKQWGWAFLAGCVTLALSTASVFLTLYPDVVPSTLNPAWSLSIQHAASNPYSLRVMTIVAVSVLPIVLAYQGWTYWVFRRRIRLNDAFHY
jgi:cytochrome d ubiquinol oxidase subunit II